MANQIAIHTKVVDNGEGSLVVEHAFATDDVNATFVNTYAHGTTSVVLGATKVLSGKALADGQFTFALTVRKTVRFIRRRTMLRDRLRSPR